MPRLFITTLASLFVLLVGDAALAASVEWTGTLETKLGAARRFYTDGSHQGLRGSGVATINGSGSAGLITTLRLDGGITGSDYNPVTDPDTNGTIASIGAQATLGVGTLKDLNSPPLTSNVLTAGGFSRICLLAPGCANGSGLFIEVPYSDGPSNKIGVGGILTAGRFGNVRISIEAGPWTIGSGSAINQTQKGAFQTVTASGFAHAAASGSSAVAAASGMIQLISPMQVTTIGAGDNNDQLSLFSILTLHFIPEPGFLLLIGAGVTGLGILGRNRMRR
jgi:hypothetical protein